MAGRVTEKRKKENKNKMALEPCGINQHDELHLNSFFFFYPPLKVCVADQILANIIYRFDDQYFLTSKTGLYLKDLRTASDRHYRYAP